jgi:hypothetical protein
VDEIDYGIGSKSLVDEHAELFQSELGLLREDANAEELEAVPERVLLAFEQRVVESWLSSATEQAKYLQGERQEFETKLYRSWQDSLDLYDVFVE